MSLRINGTSWEFCSVHGEQYLNGTKYAAMIHADRQQVTVSDSIPLDDQLQAAAKAALRIRRAPLLPACAVANGWADEDFDRNQEFRRRRS